MYPSLSVETHYLYPACAKPANVLYQSLLAVRQKIIAGNWKMNKTRTEALELAATVAAGVSGQPVAGLHTLLFPAFPLLSDVHRQISGIDGVALGAQNMHHETQGAYTGEVSAAMLASIGVSHVILGHSERRQYFAEDDALLLIKVQQALAHGLTPVFCIGETLPERESNTHFEVIRRQLEEGLLNAGADTVNRSIVAYEPVWAIGTGVTATSTQAQEMHAFIRSVVAEKSGNDVAQQLTLLYGGSCNPANAAELFACPDVDGGLIGGASLKAADFLNIRTAMRQQLTPANA
jgi:triosephosphate isomerase (TIM)